MANFCLLVFPLPHRIRKPVFRFLSKSPLAAKAAYVLKIAFIFVGVLFIDALQRMLRITAESELAKSSGVSDARSESSFAARKFYAQRNTYLTGFCLFLSLVLDRTFYIILDLIHTQEEYAKLKQQTANHPKSVGGNQTKQIDELKKKLAAIQAKVRDFEMPKKRAVQQVAEYDALATRYNAATGLGGSDKRKA